jgi:hypothetical protein
MFLTFKWLLSGYNCRVGIWILNKIIMEKLIMKSNCDYDRKRYYLYFKNCKEMFLLQLHVWCDCVVVQNICITKAIAI